MAAPGRALSECGTFITEHLLVVRPEYLLMLAMWSQRSQHYPCLPLLPVGLGTGMCTSAGWALTSWDAELLAQSCFAETPALIYSASHTRLDTYTFYVRLY